LDEFSECQFTMYSGTPASQFRNVGIEGPNIVHTRVGFDEVVDAMKRHDLLFLPHGFEGGINDIEYATIFPTRTIPYLLAGVPILAHSPPNAFLTRWLQAHDCAEVVDTTDKDDLINALTGLIRSPDRQRTIASNALDAARQFRISKVSSILKTTINQTNQVTCVE